MDSTDPQSPTLFLSHSGSQKGFVWSLYQELLHAKHSTFFDQDSGVDSLPKGCPFPSRIVEACRGCKLGVVVLSPEYIESLWPMFELQELMFHNRNKPDNVYPIFHTLKPGDLSEVNLKRWQNIWREKEDSWQIRIRELFADAPGSATLDPQPFLDINLCSKALKMLRSQSGSILPLNKNEPSFIQTIVSDICKRFRPPQFFRMTNGYVGAAHVSEEIHKAFQEQEGREGNAVRNLPIVVGMHGLGGSGKSTACKFMVNFYDEHYPGNCFLLEFPSESEHESKSLVQSIKDILSTRGNQTFNSMNSLEQALTYFQQFLRWFKVFLVLDNVWDWAIEIVKDIATMEFESGSRLLVTARSLPLLQSLGLKMKIIHVPSITEEEARKALVAYSSMSRVFPSETNDLQELARSCFFDGRCHPLLLKGVGTRLRHAGGRASDSHDWARLVSNLRAKLEYGDEDIESTVLSVLRTSFEPLRPQLKEIFLKLGTCMAQFGHLGILNVSLCEWLAMISDHGSASAEDISDQLVELEYHGLLEIEDIKESERGKTVPRTRTVKFHDLQLKLIDVLSREKNSESRKWLLHFPKVGQQKALAILAKETSDDEWRKFKYIYYFVTHSMICGINEWRCMSPHWECIEVLHLQDVTEIAEYVDFVKLSAKHVESLGLSVEQLESLRLSVEHMKSLRHLVLMHFHNLAAVGGWHGASKLTSVKLINCGLQNVESMARLQRLESLEISSLAQGGILEGVNDLAVFLGYLPKLCKLDFPRYKNSRVDLRKLFSNLPSLQWCNLRDAEFCKFPNLNLPKLKMLDLSGSDKLECMEGSVCSLTALEKLCLNNCKKLELIPDLKQLDSLRVLELQGCVSLKEVKVENVAPLETLDLELCDALTNVKLGDAAVTSLKHLTLHHRTYCLMSTAVSSSPPPISNFTNLRWLKICGTTNLCCRDFLGTDLPVSLEYLHLAMFETGSEITSLSRLVNLVELSVLGCESLESITGLQSALKSLDVTLCASLCRITGLAPLTNLEEIRISNCKSLYMVGHWELPLDRYALHKRVISVQNCPNLDMSGCPFRRCIL